MVDKWVDLSYAFQAACEGIRSPASAMIGSIAQLGEHLPYKQRVTGSSPVVPTIRSGSTVG